MSAPAMPPGMDERAVRQQWPLALDSLPPGVDRLSNYDGDLWAGHGGDESVWLAEETRWSQFVTIREYKRK